METILEGKWKEKQEGDSGIDMWTALKNGHDSPLLDLL